MRKSSIHTFSYEDELVQRGANPRTGLITPFTQLDRTGDDTPTDYLSSRRAAPPGILIERRDDEDHSNILDANWSSVDGLFASPDYLVRNQQQVSPSLLGQRSDPMLRNIMWRNATTSENMEVRQRTLPKRSPNWGQGTHEINRHAYQEHNTQNEVQPAVRGARSAMKKMNKIPRKEVGGSVASSNSSDIGLNYGTKVPQILDIQPDQVAGGNVVRWQDTNDGWYEDIAQDRFLESSTQRIPKSQNGVSRDDVTVGDHNTSTQISQNRPGPLCTMPSLSQRLPLVRLRHPSHFTNLEQVGHDREAHRLPPSLRSGSQKRRALEQIAVMGPIASAPPMKQRPRMQRQENHAMMLRSREERRDHGGHGWITAEPPSNRFTDSPEKRVGAAAGPRSRDLRRNHKLTKVDETVTEAGEVRVTTVAQEEWSEEAKPLKSPTTLDAETSQESTAAPLRSRDTGGGGSTTVQDSTRATKVRISRSCATDTKDLSSAEEKKKNQTKSRRGSKTETTGDSDGTDESRKSQTVVDSTDVRKSRAESSFTAITEAALTEASSSSSSSRPLSGFSQLQALNTLLLQTSRGSSDWSSSSAAARSKSKETNPSHSHSQIHWFLGLVGCHVASTLIRALIAVQILGDPEARVRDYVAALRDIVLALFYLLAILHVLNLTRHVIAAVSAVLFYAWHPFQAAVLLVRWFVGT